MDGDGWNAAGGAVGGDPEVAGERVDDRGDDGVADNVPVPVPPQDLPLRLPPPPHAEPLRLHLRHRLVGHRPQHDRLLRRFPCKSSITISSSYIPFQLTKQKDPSALVSVWPVHSLSIDTSLVSSLDKSDYIAPYDLENHHRADTHLNISTIHGLVLKVQSFRI